MLFADACYELCRPISDELTSKRRASSEMKTALTTDAHRLFPSSVTIVPSVVRSSSLLRIRRPLLLPEVGSSSPVRTSSRRCKDTRHSPIDLAQFIPPQHKRKGRIFHSQHDKNEHIVLLQPTSNSHPRPFGSSGRHNCRIAFFVSRWSSRCVLVRPPLDTAVSQIISHCSARLLGRWRHSATSSHVDPRRSASPRSNVQQ